MTPSVSSRSATVTPSSTESMLAMRTTTARTAASWNCVHDDLPTRPFDVSVEAISPEGRLGASLIARRADYTDGTEKPTPTRSSAALRSSIRRIDPIGMIERVGLVVLDPLHVDRDHPEARLGLDAVEHEAAGVHQLDLDERLLDARRLRERRDRAVQPLDEGLVRALRNRRPDAAQKSFALCGAPRRRARGRAS